jgi:NitT/TauT family transport system substrate-binding protein
MRSVASSWVDAAPNLTVATYFTSQTQITKNPDLVRRFGEAMKESLAYADAHPDEVRQILSTYTQIKADAAAELILPKWPADINRASVQTLADLALADGLLPSKPDLTALLP